MMNVCRNGSKREGDYSIKKVQKIQIRSFWNVEKAQYGKGQLNRSHDWRICVRRSSKREKKALKYYMRTEKAMETSWEEKALLNKLLNGRMEGKRGRGMPRIMMLDEIKADETNEKIKRRAIDRELDSWIVGETGFLEPAFMQSTNNDDEKPEI